MSGTTSVPAITFGTTGLIAPAQTAILAGVEADLNAAFGGNLNFTNPQAPQGQLATTLTAIIGDKDDQILAMQSNMDPEYSAGRWQDGIARIYFLTRNPAEATVIQVLCTGSVGVVIPAGALLQDQTTGYNYYCTNGGTIGSGGTIPLAFANTAPGPNAVPSSVAIYQAINGWDSVSVVSGVIGSNVESRQAFEQRREDTVAGNSIGAIGSIIGAVAKVPGVTDYFGYDNATASTATVGGVSVAANSIYICVQGGTTSAVAQAILSKKAPGCGYTGTTTVTAYDNNPLYSEPIAYSVSFTIPTALPIYFAVNLKNSTSVPSTALAQIQAAISAAFAGTDGGSRARIGTELFASRFYAGIASLGAWAQIISLQIGTTSPGAANDLTVNANQIPTLNVANITLTLT